MILQQYAQYIVTMCLQFGETSSVTMQLDQHFYVDIGRSASKVNGESWFFVRFRNEVVSVPSKTL